MPFSVLDSAGNHKTTIGSTKLDELDPPTDVTTLNASSSAHGLMPKADANAGHFYSSDGTQKQVPLASGVSGDLPVANLSNGTFTAVDSTATGAQNNWAPGLDGNTLVTWHGASDIAITGIAGGVVGQVFALKNTGTTIATFAHNSGSSSAGNKLFNLVTSAPTPVAAGGWIAYQHDGTQWQLIGHDHGSWILPTFSAGDYTGSGAMTVTVDAGDVGTFAYLVRGRTVSVSLVLNTVTVGGTPSYAINVQIPGGFLVNRRLGTAFIYNDNGTAGAGLMEVNPGSTLIALFKSQAAPNWSAAANTTYIECALMFEVQ